MNDITPNMQLAMQMSLLQTNLNKRITNALSMHGISFTEFQVMLNLSIADKQTLRRIELAESVGLTASGVTRLLAPMEKIKLVEKEKNARDARVSLVKLSKVGKKILKESLITFEQASSNFMKNLTKNETQHLLKLMVKL